MKWGTPRNLTGEVVAQIDGHAQGIKPKMHVDGTGPAVGGMQKHGASMFSNVANAALNLTILMVSTNAAEGDGLSRSLDGVAEQVVCESAIVGMISRDFYSVRVGEAFKGFFCLKRFLRGVRSGHMHVGEVGKLVDENGGNSITLFG